jgi:hypothetical protein
METMRTREVRLVSRPQGRPVPADFALETVDLPEAGDGEVLVRNLVMSVDPYMRGRMNDAKSYAPPYRLGAAMTGGAVGEVVSSRAPGLTAGDLVLSDYGWREHVAAPAKHFRPVTPLDGISPSVYLSVLGMTGLTAYVGLLDVARMRPGEIVFISGAAGAVGSMAGQIAKLRGAGRVIGSVGSDAKVAHVVDRLGFDAAFNYKSAPVRESLAEAAGDGIDVYFDNVGGEHLEAAIGALRLAGRAAICGMISLYNDTTPAPGPRNLIRLVQNRLTLQGFLVGDHYDRYGDFLAEASVWLREGRLDFTETVMAGLDHAVEAFLAMLDGANTGKMVVRLT